MRTSLSRTLLLLLLPVAIFSACRKKDDVKATTTTTSVKSTPTSKMGGVRNWHGSHYYTASGMHFPTPVNEFSYYPDEFFALDIIDSNTVKFKAETFKYDRTDTGRSVYYFGKAYYYDMYGSGTGIAYYFKKDSIVHCEGDVHGTSDSWRLRNLYYTY